MSSKKAASKSRKTVTQAVKQTKKSLRAERAQIAVPHPNHEFGYKHHIFIAKLKRGEVWALNQLNLPAKGQITPLFEMWPPNPGTAIKPAKPLTQHVSDLLGILAIEWANLPCYIDTQYLQAGGAPSPGNAQTVFATARNLNVNAVPVTSPYHSPQFQQVIRDTIKTDGRGVMLRLPVAFFDLPNPAGYLDGLTTFLEISRNEVDILIDLAFRPNVIEVQSLGGSCLNKLPHIGNWRTVTLAAGCFPESISDEPVGTWLPFNRSDWNGWLAIYGQRRSAKLRLPSYGDYGVRCGGKPNFIPNSPAPNIRYSAPQTTWVRKGPRTAGSMGAICADLVAQPHFSGTQFSQGDADIAAKAAMTNLTNGSAEQWIQWCTNHHLEMTASQIQNLP
ncbi:hypothetical protein FTW19_03585 [Terriglobus albidus]|uniref:Uncharacterized protein n=1 Tax=Terriglobus albidus TaxID=1592106 RepID=A0A5B9E7N5_9BACT|nr:hypothetical protein [Terriglobus albidus]QEE27175.1 hypothetical protein FTW19_03585 [Terriglobus albidus]